MLLVLRGPDSSGVQSFSSNVSMYESLDSFDCSVQTSSECVEEGSRALPHAEDAAWAIRDKSEERRTHDN